MRCFGCIHKHGATTQGRDIGDIRLDIHAIEAVVATHHHRHIGTGQFHHGNGVVDCGMRDVVATLLQAVAQRPGVGREAQLHIQAVCREATLRLCGVERQILYAFKYDDPQCVG